MSSSNGCNEQQWKMRLGFYNDDSSRGLVLLSFSPRRWRRQ